MEPPEPPATATPDNAAQLGDEPSLRRLASLSQDGLCIADTEGYFRWLSPAFSAMTGYSQDELYARPFIEFVHPEDVQRTVAEAAGLARGDETISFENRYRCKAGGYVWLQWNARLGPDGFLYAVARDVTAAKEAEQRELEQTRLLLLAEELARVGHWRIDLVANTVSWSDEVYRIHGLTRASHTPTVEKGIEAYHPDDRAMVERNVQRAIEEREDFDFEARLLRSDGEVRDVRAIGRVEFDAYGEPIAIPGVFQDITEAKRVERLKDELIATVSHELRTPLTAIRGAASALRRSRSETSGEPAGPRLVEMLLRNSERLSRIVDDVLDVAKLQAGELAFDQALLDLRKPVGEAVESYQSSFAEHEQRLRLEAFDTPVPVSADAGRIVQVMNNLLSNAMKFSQAGAEVTVRVRAEQTQGVIEVQDQGIGIPPEALGRLFLRFYQVDTGVARRHGGAGLGLAICRLIVERGHGGTIEVESIEGVGSLFRVRLPLRSPAATL